MLGERERHRDGKRIGVPRRAPFFVVRELESRPGVGGDAADHLTIQDCDQLARHFLGLRAAFTMESMSAGVSADGAEPSFGFSFSGRASRAMPSAFMARSTRPICARGLPFSISTIHSRLTPISSARAF